MICVNLVIYGKFPLTDPVFVKTMFQVIPSTGDTVGLIESHAEEFELKMNLRTGLFNEYKSEEKAEISTFWKVADVVYKSDGEIDIVIENL